MIEKPGERVEITSFDGHRFAGFLYRPAQTPAPGVVMIPEIYGLTQPLRETATRFSNEGFAVLTLDIFSRFRPGVVLAYDKAGHAEGRAYHDVFDYAVGMKDVQAAVTRLRARPECNGRVGVTGFCLGGTMAYLSVARTDADAAVSYYGTRIHNFLDDAKAIDKPLILHFGECDHTTPPELLARILPAVAGNPLVTSHIYPDAVHAFANHGRPDTYNAAATKLADERTFALFRKVLVAEPAGVP
jgi:carboxymethylenebutenolidase